MKKKTKNMIRIQTWNVLTLLQKGKIENTTQEMIRNKSDVLGMS